MSLLHDLRSRVSSLFKKRKLDAEMNEEMRLHLELLTEHNIEAGMPPEDARYAAQRKFGGVEQLKERGRDERGWIWLENVRRDVRFSLRSLRRSAGFSVAVIITLALCIGANTTIMSVLYGLILKPLPFHDAGQLVEVYSSYPNTGQLKEKVGLQQYLDYKTHADLFRGFAMWWAWSFNLEEDREPVRGSGSKVTADYFTLLGVQPLLGRFFTMEECVAGKDRVGVLTQTYWERRYNADPSVIGRVIRLNGEQFTIVGVAPRSLEAFNSDATILKPMTWREQDVPPAYRGSLGCKMYARIKTDVTHTAALAQLMTLEKNFYDRAAAPELREYLKHSGFIMGLGPVRVEQTKSIRTSLLLLQGGSLFVLLLGCLNVANLMLARANARQGELAVRQALGAGRVALARQMFVEGVLLAAGGAVLGLGLVWVSLRVINTYVVAIVREVQPIAMDGTVLGATMFSALLIAAATALLPVITTWRTNLLTSLQGGGRTSSAGGRMRTISGLLITGQVALALVLLVGAGLLLRSFDCVMAVNPGFDVKHVVQGRVALGPLGKDRESVQRLQALIVERMKEIPGVEKVGYTFGSPVTPIAQTSFFPIRGTSVRKNGLGPEGMMLAASSEYFEAMGMRLLEGRNFTEEDIRPQARMVFVVDQNFARKNFPGRSAVGATFDFWNPGGKPDRWPIIIGVVSAAKLSGLDDVSGTPFVFFPRPAASDFSLVVRTARPASEIVPLMREKLRSADPGAALSIAGSLQESLDDLLANRRGMMSLLGAFAGVALLLSAVGIYGMLAYDVVQRTKEIGIRGAVGATRGRIVAMILRQGLWKTGIGLVIGLGGAFYLSRYLGSLLFEVKPTDPLVFGGVSVLLLLVALLASWLPAWRAAKIDPVIALRAE